MTEDAEKSPSVRAPKDTRIEYLMREMSSARERIDEEIRTINQFEIFSIIAIGLLYWFIFASDRLTYLSVVFCSFVPLCISLYGIFRYRAHAHIVKVHEGYIKFHVERTIYGSSSLKGLAKYYDRKKKGYLKVARFIFWGVIATVTFAIFIIFLVAPGLLSKNFPEHKAVTLTEDQKNDSR